MGFVRIRIRAPESERDPVLGELFELGTRGVEELPQELLAYFEGEAPVEALRALAARRSAIVVSAPEPVPEEDWSARWREGLAPRRVGPLWIRPSWCAPAGLPELVLDPGQAFGSGEHASTRLALELLLEELRRGDRVLDVGTGSGVLALGALRCGARSVVAFDLDPRACREARANARRNELSPRLFCGTADALCAAARFDRVVANLLLKELLPLLPALVRHRARALIVSGYLAAQRPALLAALRAADARLQLAIERSELQSGDRWQASLWTP
jgi:ribosomal protein L11 methyltransferase